MTTKRTVLSRSSRYIVAVAADKVLSCRIKHSHVTVSDVVAEGDAGAVAPPLNYVCRKIFGKSFFLSENFI